jgi:hypothetical protein
LVPHVRNALLSIRTGPPEVKINPFSLNFEVISVLKYPPIGLMDPTPWPHNLMHSGTAQKNPANGRANVGFLALEKRAKAAAVAPNTLIKHFLPRASFDGCRDFGIGAKLAAIKAISRVFPSSVGINYQVA